MNVKACGLIVEYNPFHNGHLYHVNKSRVASKADCIVAVMSGNFLQRGEPAIIDKFHRTKMALANGVDLVIELPYAYAVQSSHYFALGALKSLHALKVAAICFGRESANIEQFYETVEQLQHHRSSFDTYVQKYIERGYSYPTANSLAYKQIGMQHLDLFQPNNILGFSYVKTIIEQQFP